MTSRQRVFAALQFMAMDRIPLDNRHPELASLPNDVLNPPYRYPVGRSWGRRGIKGRCGDIWGCVWEMGEDGVAGEVKEPPFGHGWDGLKTYRPPYEVVKGADLSAVNGACAATDKFTIAMWDAMPNPFERMQHMRGSEQLYMDLAYLDRELYRLRDMIHEYFMGQLDMWVKTDIDAIHIADDWGSQTSLLISPDLWRSFFKPLYKDYCDLAHSRGKFVLMHSDGYILPIIGDLIEIGVNAVNAQLFCMPIEALAAQYAGKICFWGEIDRQRLLTSGTEQETRLAVRRVANAFLPHGRTGIVGQCFEGKGHKLENMAAVYDEWTKA